MFQLQNVFHNSLKMSLAKDINISEHNNIEVAINSSARTDRAMISLAQSLMEITQRLVLFSFSFKHPDMILIASQGLLLLSTAAKAAEATTAEATTAEATTA